MIVMFRPRRTMAWDFRTALEAVTTGEIGDAKTIMLLQRAALYEPFRR